jgi:hypothetical protein
MQADPTVVYALVQSGHVRRKHPQGRPRPSTRRTTPIIPGSSARADRLPGRASLEAALAPADVDYLYFVSKNDGSHAFAEKRSQSTTPTCRNNQVQYFRKQRLSAASAELTAEASPGDAFFDWRIASGALNRVAAVRLNAGHSASSLLLPCLWPAPSPRLGTAFATRRARSPTTALPTRRRRRLRKSLHLQGQGHRRHPGSASLPRRRITPPALPRDRNDLAGGRVRDQTCPIAGTSAST